MARKKVVLIVAITCLWLGSGLVLASPYVPPHVFWPAGVVTYFIPLVVVVHLIVAIYGAIKRLKWAIPSGILLAIVVAGWVVPSESPSALANDRFTVLSYNASFFHNPGRWKEDYASALVHQQSIAMKEWLAIHDADIKCVQEFYNHDDSPIFNTITTIGRQGEYHHFFADSPRPYDWDAGLAIFSRFPIIDTGQVFFSRNAYNKAAFADLLIENDTIRVINVHLQSVGLETSRRRGFWAKTIEAVRKVKHGLVARSWQTKALLKLVNESPHPVIVCGDMNELPFGNVYLSFKSRLQNAHEAAGQGAGFTYNHPWLFFLRVDHQFYDPTLSIYDFKTCREVAYSDNFPIVATYSVSK